MDTGRRLTIGVLSLALLARVAVFALTGGVLLQGEGRIHTNLATNLLQGNGYQISRDMLFPRDAREAASPARMSTFDFYREVDGFYGVIRPETPTIFLVPGTAFFQAAVFALAGVGNLAAVDAVQLVLGLFTVLMGLVLARRFLEGPWLVLAGIVMALDPFQLFFEVVPATQALFSLLFLAGLLLGIRVLDARDGSRAAPWLAAAAAAVWGLAFYVRPAALPMVPWLALVVLVGKRFRPVSIARAILLVLVFAAALFPWAARCRQVSGSWRLLPTQGGVNLWESSARMFSSRFVNEQEGALLLYGGLIDTYRDRLNSPGLAEFPAFRDEPEWVRDSVLMDRVTRFLRLNPGLFPRLFLIRFAEFFKPFPLNAYSVLYTLAGLAAFFWVLVFMVPGSLRLVASSGAPGVFLAGAVWGYALMHLITIGGIPHRVAIDFPLIIAASAGLRAAVRRWKAGREAAA